MNLKDKTLFSLALLVTSIVQASPAGYVVVEDKATLPILTTALEGRKVEKLVLKNGLKVYLISDPGTEQSAAGVAVESGSWDDPKEYPGMAHFLEHMLFMGTAAYPKEFEYMQFITDHGGKVNAFTASDRTVYMFSINNDALESAVDRFSHFFIDPLLSPHCISRELHAVDQEHSKNIEHDGWRQYMIFKETANPEHPNAKFSTGNAKTLSGIPQKALKQWYQSHYSANRMHLAVLSPLPLDQLRDLAVNAFSKVPNYKVEKEQLPAEFTSEQQRGHMFFIKPVKEIKQLTLTWEVPAQFAQDVDKQAPELVAYALNRESENGLLQLLKKEMIAESLRVSIDRFSPDALLFNIDITLTDQGLGRIDTAVKHTFEALARLRTEGYPQYLFDEAHAMSILNYQYQSRDDAFQSINNIVSQMPYEELATYPQKSRIPSVFDQKFISEFLDSLKAEDCLYSVLADPSKSRVKPDKKEKWMSAEYSIKKIKASTLTAWDANNLNPAIQLPAQNPFLPKNIALIELKDNIYDVESPLLVQADTMGKTYYVQDTRYQVPEVAFVFSFKSPLIDNSAQSQVLLNLYAHALQEKLSPTLSAASAAGLNAFIYPDRLSLKVEIQGYNDKAPLLARSILEAMKQVTSSSQDFEIYRTSLADDFNNSAKELPVVQAIQELNGLVVNMPTDKEKAAAIEKINFDAFTKFNSQLWATAYYQSLLYGNITEKDARQLHQSIASTLKAQSYPVDKQLKEKVLLLSESARPCKIMHMTERQGNGVLLLLQEGPYSFEKRGIQQILGTALQDAFFDTLRTKQQTSYYLKAWNTEEQRQLFQYFAVQSSTHSAPDLLARFELFLEDFDKNLTEKISSERFEGIRDNLVQLLSMPPENMPGMSGLLYKLAFDYEDFSWIQKRIESLQALNYEQFCHTAHALLSRSNSRRLAVLMEGVIMPENDFRYEQTTKEDVNKLGTFVSFK